LQPFSQHKSVFVVFLICFNFCNVQKKLFLMLLKKRPKKSVVPGHLAEILKKTVNIPAKKHGAPSAHTIGIVP
jgi:hypothetical protein